MLRICPEQFFLGVMVVLMEVYILIVWLEYSTYSTFFVLFNQECNLNLPSFTLASLFNI